ncbi:hypothetical protein [Streptomyces kanasensis]|uniref:hypothetical protein n=1 Tax=Streptomyces kanasensis TaxID=936756 RepID=UPI00382D0DA7
MSGGPAAGGVPSSGGGVPLPDGARVFDTARMKVAVVVGPPDRGGWYTLTAAYADTSWRARARTLVPMPMPMPPPGAGSGSGAVSRRPGP